MKPVSGILTESVIDHSFSVKRLEEHIPYSGSFVRLNYHHILMIESDRGVLVIDEHTFDIADQKIFLLSKGQICKFENHSDVCGYHISFGDCFWEECLPVPVTVKRFCLIMPLRINSCYQIRLKQTNS
jgi:hypothetical protein